MKKTMLALLMGSGMFLAGAETKTYVGVITDTMCGADHSHMGIKPDSKCVRECVKTGRWKYALLVGKEMYVLSDQQTPEKYAAEKVKVTGTLYEKTKILKVDKIEPAQ